MNVFVTGGTGFIGSYLVKELVNQGHNILCLRRNSSSLVNLGQYAKNVRWANSADDWQSRFIEFRPNAVFHLAWDGVSSRDREIWAKQVHNVELQQAVLDISLKCGVKKFIGIGSQSEYGDFEGVVDENLAPNPKTAYAAVKLACLDLLKSFCIINRIEWYWFRLFPLFGPHESENWLIPSLIKAMFTQDSLDMTLGEQYLPYLYVGECVKAIASPLYSVDKSGVYNVCADNAQPLHEMVTRIRDYVNPNFKLNFGALPYRFGQSMYMGGDTHSLSQNLYTLETSTFDDRLRETIDYYVALYGEQE